MFLGELIVTELVQKDMLIDSLCVHCEVREDHLISLQKRLRNKFKFWGTYSEEVFMQVFCPSVCSKGHEKWRQTIYVMSFFFFILNFFLMQYTTDVKYVAGPFFQILNAGVLLNMFL